MSDREAADLIHGELMIDNFTYDLRGAMVAAAGGEPARAMILHVRPYSGDEKYAMGYVFRQGADFDALKANIEGFEFKSIETVPAAALKQLPSIEDIIGNGR